MGDASATFVLLKNELNIKKVMADLNLLYEAILAGKHNVAMELTQKAIDENISPKVLIDNYLIKAMEEIGRRFEAHQAFVPELLMAGRAMKTSLTLLQPLLKDAEIVSSMGVIVIGTVKGDLHDIGKIGIDDAILNTEGKLDEQEWEMMKTHPQIGANILDKSHLLVFFSKIVLHHHERYGLNGKEIPLGLRIIALCDSIDTMT